jgi:hypothetical protein
VIGIPIMAAATKRATRKKGSAETANASSPGKSESTPKVNGGGKKQGPNK